MAKAALLRPLVLVLWVPWLSMPRDTSATITAVRVQATIAQGLTMNGPATIDTTAGVAAVPIRTPVQIML